MAGIGGFPGRNPLLSGLFGAFRSASEQRVTTSQLWRALRVNAATWQWRAQGGGEPPSADELEATGRQILHDQGVTIQGVNVYRGLAGRARTAHQALLGLGDDQQITSQHVFVPPWARTTAGSVPSRYRIRVKWRVTPEVGEVFDKWSTYELTSPLATKAEVLDQAQGLARTTPTSDQVAAANQLEATDYELEQV